MLSGGRLGGVHQDLLNAQADSPESETALVEEIKTRCRGLFNVGNYPEAELLYDKAIRIRPQDAVLYANRSAVRLNLHSQESALHDADKSVQLDPGYSKGYWRKGQAHMIRKEYQQAVAAFTRGGELDPANKAFKESADKAQKLLETASRKVSSSGIEQPRPPPSTAVSDGMKAATKSNQTSTRKKVKENKPAEAEDEDEAFKSETLRGYRVLADGRKTTYFNNEMTEETRKLIGDIAPKRIEASANSSGAESKSGVGSAWNHAGTFESRDLTDWARNRLRDLLSGITFIIPNVASVIDVVKVDELEGDASVTFVRSKKRYLYDFVFTLAWEAELDCGKAKGTLKYPDVTPDNEDEFDTILEVDQLTPPEARRVIDNYVRSSDDGIQKIVKEQLRLFRQEYRSTF